MERPSWAPDDVGLDQPNVARVYDYYLGGSRNFAVDRAFAERVIRAVPAVTAAAQENRAFLRRAVRYLVDAGVRQFVDLGSGILTVGNVHDVAQAAAPGSRVVYVDNDPVAVAHSNAVLADSPNTVVIAGDLRKPSDVLADRQLRRLIDLDQPVGFLLLSVLHFVPDEERPAEIVAGYAAAGAPGSHVAISHATMDAMPDQANLIMELYRRTPNPLFARSREAVDALFGDLAMVEPGLAYLSRWRPDPGEELTAPDAGFAGVGRRD